MCWLHVRTDLTLSYQDFDQSEGKGFRVLAAAGCNKQAADLVEAYIQANDSKQNSLTWHIAQLRASSGEYESAIAHARQVLLSPEESAKSTLRWNDYVLATIAFLEGDRQSLVARRDRVAEGVDAHFGNKLNLALLDSLIRNFDRSYEYATGHIEPN